MECLCVGDDVSDLSDEDDEEFNIGRQPSVLIEDDDDGSAIECEGRLTASSSVDDGRWRNALLQRSFPIFSETSLR